MFKNLLWQLKQFKKPFPAIDSWAFRFSIWKFNRRKKAAKKSALEFPAVLDDIKFEEENDDFRIIYVTESSLEEALAVHDIDVSTLNIPPGKYFYSSRNAKTFRDAIFPGDVGPDGFPD